MFICFSLVLLTEIKFGEHIYWIQEKVLTLQTAGQFNVELSNMINSLDQEEDFNTFLFHMRKEGFHREEVYNNE